MSNTERIIIALTIATILLPPVISAETHAFAGFRFVFDAHIYAPRTGGGVFPAMIFWRMYGAEIAIMAYINFLYYIKRR